MLILAVCILSLIVLGWLDYVTGYELGFFVFYSVPVGLAAWYVGRRSAIALALQATAAWFLADYFGGVKYSIRFFYYWNGAVHFAAFVINAVTIAKIKDDLDQRHHLAKELEIARSKLQTLAAVLAFCPVCGSSHNGSERKGQTEARAVIANCPELADAFCNDCRAKSLNSSDQSASR